MAANSEVDETVKRIMSHKGILGVVIVNNDGIPIRSTLDNVVSVQYAGLVTQLVIKSRSMVRDLQTDNDLQFLRLRSKKHEILIAPGMLLTSLLFGRPAHYLLLLYFFRFIFLHLTFIHRSRSDRDFILIVIQNPNAEGAI
jgi:dynein light chain roadblock-type